MRAVVDEFGPSDLAKIAADYDTVTQQANHAPGNALARWVFGPGTRKSILDDPAASRPPTQTLDWSTQKVRNLIVAFFRQHLGS